MKLWILFFAVVLLNGCAGYVKPVCEDTNRLDVPNLEGKFTMRAAFYHDKESKVLRQEFTVSRIAKGTYFSEENGGFEFSTCEVENQLFLELRHNIVYHGERVWHAFRLQRNGDGSFDLVLLGVDTDVLKAQNIPYEVVKGEDDSRKEGCSGSGEDGINCSINQILIVDNARVSGESFVQLLDPLSFQLKWTPSLALAEPGK